MRKTLCTLGSALMLMILVSPTSSAATTAPVIAPTDSPEQRGCCSHHQGVCGCSGGRTQCCDGTQSPSCTC